MVKTAKPARKASAKKSAAKKPARSKSGVRKTSKRTGEDLCFEKVPDDKDHLAQIAIWTDKNQLGGSFPLYGRAILGPISIDAGGRNYTMHVRSAMLHVAAKGFRQDMTKTSYKRHLSAKEVKARANTVSKEERSTGWGAKFKVMLKAYGISFQGTAGHDQKRTFSDTEKIDANIEIPIVTNLPNMTWRIGDLELGDLRKRHGFLEGDCLSYDGAEAVALCHVEAASRARDRSLTASLVISLKNNTTHIVPEGAYPGDAAVPDSVRDGEIAEAFKERLRLLAISKIEDGIDQFVIAKHVVRAVKVKDDDL